MERPSNDAKETKQMKKKVQDKQVTCKRKLTLAQL
jgi:hypothetical protein